MLQGRSMAPPRRQDSGFSLIEVLVSLSILAIGLLGMTRLQHEALRYNHAALLESQAQFLLTDMLERMRANPAGSYVIDFADPAPTPELDCSVTACSVQQMADWDLAEWRAQLDSGTYLPGGESAIVQDAETGSYSLSLRFDWGRLGGAGLFGEQRTVRVTAKL